MHKIAIFGLGFVGLAHAVFWAKLCDVVAIDTNETRLTEIKAGIIKSRETAFRDSLMWYREQIQWSLPDGVSLNGCDFVFIATPTDYDPQTGQFRTADITAIVERAVIEAPNAVIVIKSTIPMGYIYQLRQRVSSDQVLYVPEFLREVSAFDDICNPSRIIIGDENTAGEKVAELYRRAYNNSTSNMRHCGPEEAEAIKLFSNAYLATRLAFFNDLDSLAMSRGLDSKAIIAGICDDPRIGHFYNRPGFGFGGYCLPKDSRALEASFSEPAKSLISGALAANERRLEVIADAILRTGAQKVGIYRLTMENEAEEIRASVMVDLLLLLKRKGIDLCLYEPVLQSDGFHGVAVEQDLNAFKAGCDLIVTNRMSDDLFDVADKVFTRDIGKI